MQATKIDVRIASYTGEAIRIMAVTIAESGRLLISKKAVWAEAIQPDVDTVVVTDTPQRFSHWNLHYQEHLHLKEAIRCYQNLVSSQLIKIDDAIRMYDPKDVLQASRMQETGQSLEFDTDVSNGHIAVLLCAWVANQVYTGNVITDESPINPIDDDDSMMPFSI